MRFRKIWYVLRPGELYAAPLVFDPPVTRRTAAKLAGAGAQIWSSAPYMKPTFVENVRRGYSTPRL